MRSRVAVLAISVYLALAVFGCSSKPPADTTAGTANPSDTSGKESKQRKEATEARKKEPVIVPAGTALTISLGSALGSKLSQPGQTFNATVDKDVMVGNEVVIPKGSPATGTVTDAKPLGKFKGGAALQVRLDSINLNGYDLPVQTALRSFSEKGKGKRSAVLAGGGAALGGIIGGLAGGGKGAAIGLLAGGGAGAGGAAFTGNKEIVLPAESDLTFELTQDIKLERMGK
jgi:hypothetical protein